MELAVFEHREVSMSIYEEVTNRIIAELENGTVPWVKPWITSMPKNAVSNRDYSGVNVLLLWAETAKREYEIPEFLTYKQAAQLGGHVKKGEKSIRIVFTTTYKKEIDGEEKELPCIKWYRVFNVTQCEGLPEKYYHKPSQLNGSAAEEHVEAFLDEIPATIHHGGDRAFYRKSTDDITLPPREDFTSHSHYYATRLHETVHWTGHASRLDRDLSGSFGDATYAAEELVAELGAAFLCAHLGIQGELRHASYLKSWLQLFEEDKKAIFKAASKATKAADYVKEVSWSHSEPSKKP